MKKIVFIICFVLALTLVFTACSVDKVSATVNGTDIMFSEVEALVKAMEIKYTAYGVSAEDFYGDESSRAALYDGVLESLIDRRLMYDLAAEKGLAPYTDAEMTALRASAEADLDNMRSAAAGTEGVELDDMLALYGCTEKTYVKTCLDTAEYNRAYDFLGTLATPTDADYSAYFDTMLENQTATAKNSPHYLGNYAENGTLLYMPEGAVCAEYLMPDGILGEGYDYDKLAELYGESELAIVFPGSTQFSDEITDAVTALNIGESTPVMTDSSGTYIFRRIADPVLPASWQDMPQSMMDSAANNVKEAYIENCLVSLRNSDAVVRYPDK